MQITPVIPALALTAVLGLTPFAAAQHDIMLIIADDLGVDRVACYAEHPDAGHTPTIDSLAASGVLFRNAWSNPTCSPTRATLLTGRYGFRSGIGRVIDCCIDNEDLSLEAVTLPDLLSPGYATSAIGKWHLAAVKGHGLDHARALRFQQHSGSITSFAGLVGNSYFAYDKAVDGELVPSTV